uniref:Uncharacterized protein n=1 Tax=Timema genevievae TaxID=629358 RepID=A0A7R9K7W9_TIMGE|nr:unnamed protein product [Timema genevievae]
MGKATGIRTQYFGLKAAPISLVARNNTSSWLSDARRPSYEFPGQNITYRISRIGGRSYLRNLPYLQDWKLVLDP